MSLPTDEVRHETDNVRHEAAGLFKAVQEAAADWSRSRERSGSSESAGDGTAGGGTSAPCRGCPLCQLLAHVRGASPEVVDHLADAAASMAAAVSELFASQRPPTGRDGKPAGANASHPPPTGRREPEPCQHIDISD